MCFWIFNNFNLKNFEGCDFIAGPIHINNEALNFKHWCLLFISVKCKQIFYLDPQGTSQNELLNVSNNFKQFTKTVNFMKNLEFMEIPVIHQIQNDSFNCGVYVCHFFEILLSKKNVDSSNNNINENININSFRQTIIQRIKEKSKMTVCCICHQKDLPSFKRKTKKPFLNMFSNKLYVYKCKHAFHSDCFSEKLCLICEKLNNF